MSHLLVVLILFLHPALSAQSSEDTTAIRKDSSVTIVIDSTDAVPSIPKVISPLDGKGEKKGFQSTKTPMLALGFSVVLPGAGQIYDESYWKVPIIWGLGGYWIYEYIANNNNYKDYRDQYLQSLPETQGSGNGRLLRLRDFYRDERDKFGWYLGVLYLANIIDAYIGAHLYDFDVSPNLGEDGQVGVKLKLKL